MQLTIDIGNSRTKIGLFEKKELKQIFIYENNELDGLQKQLKKFLISEGIIASVNPKIDKIIKKEKFEFPLLQLNNSLKLPFKMNYKTPKTLGADRIAAAAGGKMLFPGRNVLVIDVGSCITYDFLTVQGEYIGGAISAGIQIRLKAVNEHTESLPLIHWDGLEKLDLIGNDTRNSLLSGALNGTIAELRATIEMYRERYDDIKIIICGGDADYFEKVLKNGIFAEPNIVLKGLHEILVFNR